MTAKVFYAITLLFSLVAFFGLIVAIGEKGAPQQAAGAAMAIGFAVIPYVFARCIEKLGSPAPADLAKIIASGLAGGVVGAGIAASKLNK